MISNLIKNGIDLDSKRCEFQFTKQERYRIKINVKRVAKKHQYIYRFISLLKISDRFRMSFGQIHPHLAEIYL